MIQPRSRRSRATVGWWRFCGVRQFRKFYQCGSGLVQIVAGRRARPLTKSVLRKQTINFSSDSSRLYFTQIEGPFAWNTDELPLLGGQEPKLSMANATGSSWIGSDRVSFSTIGTGIHMKLQLQRQPD